MNQRYAKDIINDFESNTAIDYISGGVDEYPISSVKAIEYQKIKNSDLLQ